MVECLRPMVVQRLINSTMLATYRTLLEEGIFRGVTLPHPSVDGPMKFQAFAVRAVIPLLLSVAAHFLDVRERQQKVCGFECWLCGWWLKMWGE